MSISSALNAGVSGLSANATRLAGISDNIANSGTYGYKRINTDFEDIVINQAHGSGFYAAGGVRATTGRLIDQRGTLVGTQNALDIAVSGRGMLPVMRSVSVGSASAANQPLMMTTTGSFHADAEGVLRTKSGLVLLGWPANADGTVPTMPRDSATGLQPIVINAHQTAADPTRNMSLGANLPADDTRMGATGAPWPLKVEYFGNLGNSESLNFTFTPQVSPTPGMSNTWRMEVHDSALPPGSNLIGSYDLTFNDTQPNGGTLASVTPVTGGAYDPITGALALTVAGGPMSLEIGRLGDPNGLTQLSDEFSPTNITKDGSPVGNLAAVEIDEKGYLRASYDTGFVRTIYQVPLVDTPNPNGLRSLDNETYQVSSGSGSFYLWNAGDGPTGAVAGYTREASTTDVAAELTDLIQTQRAYSSNAKVIQTVDEMLQETTNIKR